MSWSVVPIARPRSPENRCYLKISSPTSVMNHRDGVHHYVDSVGTHRTYGGSGWSSVSHLKKEEEENEKKRQIKIIRPERMKRVLREFERIMSDE